MRSEPTLKLVTSRAQADDEASTCDGGSASERPQDASESLEFDELYNRFASYAAKIALRILGRDDDVDDIVQDVFSVLLRNMHRVPTMGHARGFVATVTVRTVRRRMRKRALLRLFALEHDSELLQVPMPGATPEEHAVLKGLYRVLERLPSGQRVAWVLRHQEGMSLLEIAEACGCSLATAKRWIAAADGLISEEFR